MNIFVTSIRKPLVLLCLSFLIGILVFLKNAWVTEDAYILFRSLEQLFSGNGPIWNPHERVQVYTSPLWYFVLAFTRVFSSDLYLNAIIVSLALWVSVIFILKSIFKDNYTLLISILLLSASTGFFDYTSSGLENILAYFVIALYIMNYLLLFSPNHENNINKTIFHIRVIMVLFGLLICVRHDLGLLLFPATIYIVLRHTKVLSVSQWIVLASVTILPFLLFTLFSLIYYGFPFPNTAYAKLNTGISRIDMLAQGIGYFRSSLQYDTITLIVIITALISSFLKSSGKSFQCLAYGVMLYLCYIAYVGGDFMQGRFLSYAYLICLILLLLNLKKVKFPHCELLTFSTVFLYLLLYAHTPFNSPLNYSSTTIRAGIADERGFYFKNLSLYRYLFPRDEASVFPDHEWARSGLDFKQTKYKMAVDTYIGIFGYFSGTEKIIVDSLALSDPLLSRIPVTGKWRIGHFKRELPEGYIKSISKSDELIIDPELNEFYKKLKIITQDKDLFTFERFKTIYLFNVGAYDDLLNSYYGSSP